MTETRSVPRLVVSTREVDPAEDLLAFTSSSHPLAWLRRGDGVVGAGAEIVRIEVGGESGHTSRSRSEASGGGHEADNSGLAASRGGANPGERVPSLTAQWRELADAAQVDDPVGLPGTGLIGFGALAFDDASSSPSSILVPRTVLGRRGDRAWITHIARADDPGSGTGRSAPRPEPFGPLWSATLGPGALDPAGYEAAVSQALALIASGTLDKVVLARDIIGTVPAGADLRRLPRALSEEYPDCWTYAVDGILGASPETLVTVRDGEVTARVLAGTAARGASADEDVAAATALVTSAKDLDEHRYAVQSVLDSLRPHTSALVAEEEPFSLKLPNVWHLATDVQGRLSNDASALELVGSLQPTAAVAGTPTAAAVTTIAELEPFDRGRYAGPVGWIDAAGDGEWAIALRCAQFAPPSEDDATPVTAHAGAGIVAGSSPEAELLETRVKFRPIVDALA